MLFLITSDEQVGSRQSRHRHLDHVPGPHYEPAPKLRGQFPAFAQFLPPVNHARVWLSSARHRIATQ